MPTNHRGVISIANFSRGVWGMVVSMKNTFEWRHRHVPVPTSSLMQHRGPHLLRIVAIGYVIHERLAHFDTPISFLDHGIVPEGP
jgi:hypothetical protein